MDDFLHYCLRVMCIISIFSGIFAIGVLVGCEKNNNSPAWVSDFQELEELCWKFSIEKNTDWTVCCIFDSGIPSVSPNRIVMETDKDLSKALSRALLQVKNQISVDSAVLDNTE